MSLIRLISVITIGIFLSACGGGGSSSGGGSNQFAGVYAGNHIVTFNATGGSFTGEVFLTLTVNGDGSYRIVDGDGGPGSVAGVGTLAGNEFRATGTGSSNVDGVSCDLRATYAGTIDGDSAMGSTTGNGTCSRSGTSINVNFSGNFDLPKTSNVSQPRNSSFMHAASSMLQ